MFMDLYTYPCGSQIEADGESLYLAGASAFIHRLGKLLLIDGV